MSLLSVAVLAADSVVAVLSSEEAVVSELSVSAGVLSDISGPDITTTEELSEPVVTPLSVRSPRARSAF